MNKLSVLALTYATMPMAHMASKLSCLLKSGDLYTSTKFRDACHLLQMPRPKMFCKPFEEHGTSNFKNRMSIYIKRA